jgi:small subunit ribosomal protein S13
MAYLLGTNIPNNKTIIIALTKIYGVGINKSKFICKNIGLTVHMRVLQLSRKKKYALVEFVENSGIMIKGDLVRLVSDSNNRLIILRTYRGLRIKQGYPVRGQRTHTNAKTSKSYLHIKERH